MKMYELNTVSLWIRLMLNDKHVMKQGKLYEIVR
jgi:hypothetical protein